MGSKEDILPADGIEITAETGEICYTLAVRLRIYGRDGPMIRTAYVVIRASEITEEVTLGNLWKRP